MKRSPIIRAAKHNHKIERLQNYLIAALCGTFLGVLLALAI